MQKLESKHKVILDEHGNLDLKQKDNDKLDVIDAKTGKKIGFNAALRQIVLEEKLGEEIKEDDKGGGGRRKVIVPGQGEGGGEDNIVPTYIQDKINSNPDPVAET